MTWLCCHICLKSLERNGVFLCVTLCAISSSPRTAKPGPAGYCLVTMGNDSEETRLLNACRRARNPYLLPIVQLALETAMRQGELVNLRWEHINTKRGGGMAVQIVVAGGYDSASVGRKRIILHPGCGNNKLFRNYYLERLSATGI